MRALVLSATIFILSVLMITNEEQASFAVSLFSEFEDIEDGPRYLKSRGGRSSGRKSSTRGRVRLYFGSGNNSGGDCYEDSNGEVSCDKGSSTVGIVIACIVGFICILICFCYIYKNCNCCKSKQNVSVAHYKSKDLLAAEFDKTQELGTMKATPNYTPSSNFQAKTYPMAPMAASPVSPTMT